MLKEKKFAYRETVNAKRYILYSVIIGRVSAARVAVLYALKSRRPTDVSESAQSHNTSIIRIHVFVERFPERIRGL